MYLGYENANNKLIINLIGELDHHSAEEVRVKIDDRIERDNIKDVIMNFSKVTFMDSSGIGVVIGRYKKLQCKGGSVSVSNLSEAVQKVFQLSGLFKIIKCYNNLDEAVNS